VDSGFCSSRPWTYLSDDDDVVIDAANGVYEGVLLSFDLMGSCPNRSPYVNYRGLRAAYEGHDIVYIEDPPLLPLGYIFYILNCLMGNTLLFQTLNSTALIMLGLSLHLIVTLSKFCKRCFTKHYFVPGKERFELTRPKIILSFRSLHTPPKSLYI